MQNSPDRSSDYLGEDFRRLLITLLAVTIAVIALAVVERRFYPVSQLIVPPQLNEITPVESTSAAPTP